MSVLGTRAQVLKLAEPVLLPNEPFSRNSYFENIVKKCVLFVDKIVCLDLTCSYKCFIRELERCLSRGGHLLFNYEDLSSDPSTYLSSWGPADSDSARAQGAGAFFWSWCVFVHTCVQILTQISK